MEFEHHRHGSSSLSSSPKQKPHPSICFSCCFSTCGGGDEPAPSPSLLRSSSTWLRARAQELPDLVGRWGGRRRRRSASGDFRYDPISYALNFDEGGWADHAAAADAAAGNGFGCRKVSSRLPAPRAEVVVGIAWS